MRLKTGVTVIVVAAGGSRRMGFNKLLAPLAGVPVLQRSLMAFEACEAVDEILVVANGDVAQAVNQWKETGGLTKLLSVLPGGTERHHSVAEGLKALTESCEIVAVHDGARPLIRPEQIGHCVEVARALGAAVCARPMTETIKRVNASGAVVEAMDREGVWVMETPQVFERGILERAYEGVLREGLLVTDEVSAVQHLGAKVHVVDNAWANPKITFPGDLEVAECLLKAWAV
jgi:2-C-methyl-D-erythritol 4-phosphate cytidylyltransferase